MPQNERRGRFGTLQIEIAVLEAQVFGHALSVDGAVHQKRRRLGFAQNREGFGDDFDVAGLHALAALLLGATAHRAVEFHNKFATQLLPLGKGRRIRLYYDLHQPAAVAQIQEYQPAQIAAAVDPALQRDSLGDQAFVK